jgi:hypothetical protein
MMKKIWVEVLIASTVFGSPLLSQSPAVRYARGGLVGISGYEFGQGGRALEVAGFYGTADQRVLHMFEVEGRLTVYGYWQKYQSGSFGELTETTRLFIPEVSLQLSPRLGRFEFVLGAGPGWTIPMVGSDAGVGATLHGSAGLRTAVGGRTQLRLESRYRTRLGDNSYSVSMLFGFQWLR